MFNSRQRILVLSGLFSCILALLALRLAFIQLAQSRDLAAKGVAMRLRVVPQDELWRGGILDRNFQNLTDAGFQPAAVLFPDIKRRGQQRVELDPVINAALAVAADHASGPSVIKRNLSEPLAAALARGGQGGINVLPIFSRYGPEALAAHLIGHLGAADDQPAPNRRRGVKGIEGKYEEWLQNSAAPAVKLVVDGGGLPINGLNPGSINQSGERSRDVVLTLDRRIQKIVEQVMDRQVVRGAVVVQDVYSGDVLALASRPNFDQNTVGDYLKPGIDNTVFTNRALNYYYPGSIFKIVIAAAALEKGLVKPDEVFECPGEYRFNPRQAIACWKKHGRLTFAEALAESCNTTFITLGQRLGMDNLRIYAGLFGAGLTALIGYYDQTPIYRHFQPHQTRIGVGYASIGQEGVMLTPLQVAGIIAVVANGGWYIPPRVVSGTRKNGRMVDAVTPGSPVRAIRPDTAAFLRQTLVKAVYEGTGRSAWDGTLSVGGKTGSAQTGRFDEKGREVKDAWFAGFAPANNPRLAIVVLVEGGEAGGKAAAPVFREIVNEVYNRKILNDQESGDRRQESE